jgi:3,4-dihydroxy 2-butanone 4-phosphate synthase/GTP cyclohydrolase II
MHTLQMGEIKLNTIEEAIEAVRDGEIVIVVDDEDARTKVILLLLQKRLRPKWSILWPKKGAG